MRIKRAKGCPKLTRMVNGFRAHGWEIAKSYRGGYSTPDIHLFIKGSEVIELAWVHWENRIQANKAVWR